MQVSFEDFKLNKQILDAIAEAGYKEPTEINHSKYADKAPQKSRPANRNQ